MSEKPLGIRRYSTKNINNKNKKTKTKIKLILKEVELV